MITSNNTKNYYFSLNNNHNNDYNTIWFKLTKCTNQSCGAGHVTNAVITDV